MSEHTNGPWITGEVSWNEKGEVRYTLHGITTACAADARLIAAAPETAAERDWLREINAEMLEALKHARDQIRHPDQMIDAAIAKAEGRT